MTLAPRIVRSLVGKKIVMAVTGTALLAFLVVHMLGNVLIFRGQEAFNSYAAFLKDSPGLLWTARVGLLAVFLAHVVMAFLLARVRRRARPIGYACSSDGGKTELGLAAKTMLTSGLVILAFVVYHLLHFTLGVVQPGYYDLTDGEGRHDVYSMVVLGFQNVPVVTSYVVAMAALGFHLAHGVQSMTRTLGLNSPGTGAAIRRVSMAVVAAVVAGFVSVPFAVLAGILGTAQ